MTIVSQADRASRPVPPARETDEPGSTSRRQTLTREIAAEETRLARIDAEQADSRARLRALRAEAASLGTEPQIRVRLPVVAATPVPTSSADKVNLFRELFRGRVDVFPTRFVAKKTGKPGYAPACRNKFVRGICELPKIKCGDCPNQAFVPVMSKTRSTPVRPRDGDSSSAGRRDAGVEAPKRSC